MARSKFEQHIAVFGESGSGKTVLLSSFYGAAQEPANIKKSGFHLTAPISNQGNKLHSNYLGMRNKAKLPRPDKYQWDSYEFVVKAQKSDTAGGGHLDALTMVWHDYPGEWFEGRRDSTRERSRQIESFRALLGSDVALILVDGQKLRDNQGEEARYLKLIFGNFRNTLLSMRDEILVDGQKMVQFPRIWMLALSKSDLLPEVDVVEFRDLIIENAQQELGLLRDVIASYVVKSEALSVGEDFVLLSAGKFDPQTIDVSRSFGTSLMLPMSALLPFERHVRWVKTMEVPGKVGEVLLNGAGTLAAVLLMRSRKLPAPISFIVSLIGPSVLNDAADLAGVKLREANALAREKGDVLAALTTGFKISLEEAEEADLLIRSVQ